MSSSIYSNRSLPSTRDFLELDGLDRGGKDPDSPETVGDRTDEEFKIAFDSNDSEVRTDVILDSAKLAGDRDDAFNIVWD